MSKKEQIKQSLEALLDPRTKQPLGENSAVRHVHVDEEESLVTLILALSETGGREEKEFTRQVAKIVKIDHGFKGLKISYEALKKAPVEFERHTKYIAITSGKGGVGKSTVTANLAVALKRLGKSVGIIDADIYGPSIPNIMQVPQYQLRVNDENKIIPPMAYDMPVISAEFLMEDDKPLMWRGPMLGRMLSTFFKETAWDENLDFVLIDLPPGTGDVAMDVQTLIPEAHVIVVTTPHPTASHIAVKSGYMAQSLKHNVLGVVENMSYYNNPVNGAKEEIFGSGGAEEVAKALKVDLLAQIPIGQPGNRQNPSIYEMHDEIGVNYLGLANKVLKEFA
ncbi:MAG: Mrp/NBP35 family ATP-binding protein [Turicibacter sp.]|nr:Mrp/NBP35 family ATP-binding protein [Turicibacter sp.]